MAWGACRVTPIAGFHPWVMMLQCVRSLRPFEGRYAHHLLYRNKSCERCASGAAAFTVVMMCTLQDWAASRLQRLKDAV
jgi:hypothetical protein